MALTDEQCQRCGGRNIVWHVPSPWWNAVMRDPITRDDLFGIVCPMCFAELAEAAGMAIPVWHLQPEGWLPMPADPLGRQWDAERCLWVER